jgi:cellulose biosynthesis protein BcsQ
MVRDSLHASPTQLAACQALVYSLLQRCESTDRKRGFALALVSSHGGAGVSHIQSLLEQMLNENEPDCAIAFDCDWLGLSVSRNPDGTHSLDSVEHREPAVLSLRSALARYRDRVGHLNRLREVYRYVLLDCHSMKQKTDVLGLAAVVDGTIIVVECNRTTINQLDELERSIEKYGGAILGSVLNKTTGAVPNWMNALMERAGI